MIRVVAHLRLTQAFDAQVFFAVDEFRVGKFMDQEIPVDRLI